MLDNNSQKREKGNHHNNGKESRAQCSDTIGTRGAADHTHNKWQALFKFGGDNKIMEFWGTNKLFAQMGQHRSQFTHFQIAAIHPSFIAASLCARTSHSGLGSIAVSMLPICS